MEETVNRQECEDTEEIVQWRRIRLWTELCGTLEEDVLESFKVHEAKNGAY